MSREITRPEDVAAVLTAARVVAVLGAHPSPERPAFYVPAYLHQQGYRILPVNPAFVGQVLFGEPVRGTLAELAGHRVDIVDVFRRAELLEGHLEDLLAMAPLPTLVWLQAGIRHEGFTATVLGAGIDVIQDRCMYADHRAFRLPPVPAIGEDAGRPVGG